jgi:hypothetical protein
MPGQVVGRKGRSRQVEETPAVNVWKTDIIDGRDPEFEYQFFREEQVRDKLRADRIVLRDFESGEQEVHDIPPWEICRRDITGEEAAGYRPDEGKPVDNILRHGPYVAMRIPRKAWLLLQRKHEQVADGYEQRLRGGRTEEYGPDGNQVRPSRSGTHLTNGNIRMTEHPLGRI